MIYAWESTGDSFYPYGFYAERTTGLGYDLLQVEQTNEGWHGILMNWWMPGEDAEPWEEAEYAMQDEQVFEAKYAAVLWAETMDASRSQAEPTEDINSPEYWERLLVELTAG